MFLAPDLVEGFVEVHGDVEAVLDDERPPTTLDSTWVLALGIEGARTHTALAELANLPGGTAFLRALIESIETLER